MRKLVLMVWLIFCMGCTLHKHHEPMDEALRLRIEQAMHKTLVKLDIDPATIPERRILKETSLLANHARNAEPAFAAIAEQRITDDQLRSIATYATAELQKKVPGAQPPKLLSGLMSDPTTDLTHGERELLLALINQMCADTSLVLPDRDTRRFLNHAVPEDEPGLKR